MTSNTRTALCLSLLAVFLIGVIVGMNAPSRRSPPTVPKDAPIPLIRTVEGFPRGGAPPPEIIVNQHESRRAFRYLLEQELRTTGKTIQGEKTGK